MRLLRVLLVRAAEADVRAHGDERRSVVGAGPPRSPPRSPRCRCRPRPAGCASRTRRTRRHVLRPGHRRRAVELDAVVVVQDDELAQAQVAGQARGLRRDALQEVAVAGDDVGPVVDDRVPGAVELGGQAPLGDGHADRVRDALAERTGRRLDAGRQAVLRMAGRPRAPLPERLEVVEREVVAGQVEQRVQEHRGVAGRQDEAVAIRPVRVGRGVAQEARPEHVGHRRRAHRGARVAGVRLLDAIDRQGPDGVDRRGGRGRGGRRWSWADSGRRRVGQGGRVGRHCRRRAILDHHADHPTAPPAPSAPPVPASSASRPSAAPRRHASSSSAT